MKIFCLLVLSFEEEMFSYFQNTPDPDLEQNQPSDAKEEPMPEGLYPVDASEKATLLSQIDQNKYS